MQTQVYGNSYGSKMRIDDRTLVHRLTHGSTERYIRDAGWSSPVARWAHNPKVVGSNPTPATNQINKLRETKNPIKSPLSPNRKWPPNQPFY